MKYNLRLILSRISKDLTPDQLRSIGLDKVLSQRRIVQYEEVLKILRMANALQFENRKESNGSTFNRIG